MSGSCSFASVPLRSECLGFSSGSQREWSWGSAMERLGRTTILHSEERETQNQSARRSTSEIRGWRCGFMRRTGGDEAEIGGGVARRRGVRQPAWFRRKADIATASEWAARTRWRPLLSDRMAGATANKAEGALFAAG